MNDTAFMSREDALALLREHVSTEWLLKHSIASAAVMRAIAGRLGGDPEVWWTVGLLHDLDFDTTQDPSRHGSLSAEILEARGVPKQYIDAIRAHNAEGLGLERSTGIEFALAASETVTGLIVATALVMPDKKIAAVKPGSVVKRMAKKDFARNVSRERILECERAGIPLESFVATALEAMQEISDDLGL